MSRDDLDERGNSTILSSPRIHDGGPTVRRVARGRERSDGDKLARSRRRSSAVGVRRRRRRTSGDELNQRRRRRTSDRERQG
jgi:hypothetical protein